MKTKSAKNLLDINRLTVDFKRNQKIHTLLKNVSIKISENETVGIIGENGSGKTMLAHAILGLLDQNSLSINDDFSFSFYDKFLDYSNINNTISNKVSVIFQDTLSYYNPVFTVGSQFVELIKQKLAINTKDAKRIALEWLSNVNIDNPKLVLKQFPHQLSGGMRQRIMLAMALFNSPALLIADEPTSSLDENNEEKVLILIKQLISQSDTALIFISHNFEIIKDLCERVIVMYNGIIVEGGKTKELMTNPKHPYTLHLINSAKAIKSPKLKDKLFLLNKTETESVENGCPLYPICTMAEDDCQTTSLPFIKIKDQHHTRCIHHEKLNAQT